MKPNRLIQKIFAIILLFVFSQKAVVGLYLHNWLHVTNSEHSSSNPIAPNVTSYTCNCADDFSMPFTESSACINQTISSPEAEFIGFHKFLVPFTSTFFYSLRGPPVI